MKVPSILTTIDSTGSYEVCSPVWKPLQRLLAVITQLNATYRGDYGGVKYVLGNKDWEKPPEFFLRSGSASSERLRRPPTDHQDENNPWRKHGR